MIMKDIDRMFVLNKRTDEFAKQIVPIKNQNQINETIKAILDDPKYKRRLSTFALDHYPKLRDKVHSQYHVKKIEDFMPDLQEFE